jgi:hypothetical protein
MPISQKEGANQKKVRIRCSNPNCDYSWMYSGRLLYYATCPSCRRNVKIHDNKIELPQSVQVGPQVRLQRSGIHQQEQMHDIG